MALKSGRVGIHPSQVDPITGMLLSGPSGSTNYNDLSNKPQINGVTLSGNKTTSDLHIEAGASDLSDLDDVSISNPEAGQTLQYTGTGWENVFASISPVTPATLASLQDVMLSDLQDGDFITYDSTSEKWINTGEAPAPEYTDITVTMYGAVEDTISFTDAAGISHSEVFASGQSSKSLTFKINPSGSTSITFTSAVAKNPDDLTADYSKTVIITNATTEIKVMPDNALYWYGYKSDNLEDLSTANGWSFGVYTFTSPTYSTNKITCSAGATQISGIGSSSTVSGTVNVVYKGITPVSNAYADLSIESSKTISFSDYESVNSNTLTKTTRTISGSKYVIFESNNNRSCEMYALWYE